MNMFSKKRKEDDEDDMRSFADMNVEGLPWYRPKQDSDSKGEKLDLSPKEYKYFIRGVLKAALLVGAVFIGAYFLFIFFLDFVVFKN